AARLLSARARSVRVSRLLRGALLDGRAEHDRLPAARGGAVPALGRAGAGRIRVRAEAPRRPARRGRRARGARAPARRPPGADPDLAEEGTGRGSARAPARLARFVAAARLRPGAPLLGRHREAARPGGGGARARGGGAAPGTREGPAAPSPPRPPPRGARPRVGV